MYFWFGRHGGGYDTRTFTVDETYTPLTGDFDGDGFDDIYWYGTGTNPDLVWYGNADVDNTDPFDTGTTTIGGTYSPAVGDFDGNGADDIFWYAPGTTTDIMWWATGTRGGWTTASGAGVQYPGTGTAKPVVGNFDGTQDIDGDGNPDPARDDLYFAVYGGGTMWWGATQASFGTATGQYIPTIAATQPFAGDFDGDGRDDLFMYAAGSGADRILWGANRNVFNTSGNWGTGAATSLTSSYRYDTGGTRAAKTVGTTTSEFTWTASGGLPLMLGQHDTAGSSWIIYGPGGQPIEEIRPTLGARWLHHDQLGSIRSSTYTSNGAIYRSRTYNAYGQVASVNNTTNQPLLSYAGQYTDTETGYQYLRARYYDTRTGQFLTEDPIAVQTEEPYGYSWGNPSFFNDPTGNGGNPGMCTTEADTPACNEQRGGPPERGGGISLDEIRDAAVAVANTASGVNQAGLAYGMITSGGKCHREGTLAICDGAVGLNDGQWAFGNVIMNPKGKRISKSRLRHEGHHSLQYALLGWGFFPIYGVDLLLEGRCSSFEQNAGFESGGYNRTPATACEPPPCEGHGSW